MKYIFGNWKMYLDWNESDVLSRALAQEKFNLEKIELAVFPSALTFKQVADNLAGSGVTLGAQDISWEPKGAYTGGVSALMYKDLGAKYGLVGHSERRYVFGDTDEIVRKKLEAALDAGLIPVVCVGETKEDRDNNKREYRLKKQLLKAFENLNLNGGEIIVAYEPVWAIGTGDACCPADADDVQGWIKLELKQFFGRELLVLYGGSVKAENVVSYLALESADGVLVGGASAKIETFLPLMQAAKTL